MKQKLERVKENIQNQYSAEFVFSKKIVDFIAEQGEVFNIGARCVDNVINQRLLPDISGKFLQAIAKARIIRKIEVNFGKENGFLYKIKY